MTHIFVSGCYDILHAGHIQFFREARALGDELTVCFASADVLWKHKRRRSSLPDEHKAAIIASLTMVDRVVMGTGAKHGLDFEDHFLRLRPDVLAVTEDDQYGDLKRALCARVGAQYHILAKTPPSFTPVSTTQVVRLIRAPSQAPLRIDFAGGWLDVPRFARPGAHIVNCAISPLVSLQDWPYRARAGLGGSGAYALLRGDDSVVSELNLGVGWQDPAVIFESGLCVWKSGPRPRLELKRDGEMLRGCMALWWSGTPHDTPGVANLERDYDQIAHAGGLARQAVIREDLPLLADSVDCSYRIQLLEGMTPLPAALGALAKKYCGGGWGGYAVYLFQNAADRDRFVQQTPALAIEPYLRSCGDDPGEAITRNELPNDGGVSTPE
ncbi:MAG: adenylyltransferase/cytidyltransferase family protein [Pirellulaceae bacterium]|nr:adenylyltransferase/cytidyltransferase family protein [Pirellulaceae bacterium]